MLREEEQLEIWWESLSDDQRDAVLNIDPDDDPPGWMVASLVAANVRLSESPETGSTEDIKYHVPQAIQEFVAQKRADI